MEKVVIKVLQECGLPNSDDAEFQKVVSTANGLHEYWGNKEAAAAGTIYLERIPVKIKVWNLYDSYDDYVREDNIDAKLLSYLNSEQKNTVRDTARKMLRQSQASWQQQLRNMDF